jgi:hypothetical protein
MEKHKTTAASKEAEKPKHTEKSDEKEISTKPMVTASEPTAEASDEKAARTKKRKLDLTKYRKPATIVVIVLALLGAAYHFRGIFIAAVVDGSPISRLSVIRELEKQAGQQALDRLVTKKLVEAEVLRKNIIINPADVDEEIGKIEGQVKSQGGTLGEALAQQGMTEADLREQLSLQKQLEKILGDKIKVADEDVARYMEKGGGMTPAGMDGEDFKNQIREQLKGQKFNDEVGKWIAATKAKASISYYAGYAVEENGTTLMEAVEPEEE